LKVESLLPTGSFLDYGRSPTRTGAKLLTDHEGTSGKRSASVGALRSNLPEYAKPPVVEVAISVQFEELAGFRPVHFGLYWELIRDRYPVTEHHPPLASVVELFGTRGSQAGSLSIESQFPVGRCWYLSSDGLRLVQLQPDRFVLNWRKLDTDIDYPRYERLREIFQSELESFLEFATRNELGGFEPTQCELTYVNHLVSALGGGEHGELSKVLSVWSGKTTETYLPKVEDARLAWQYRFEENSSPIGRLHVQVKSAMRTRDRTPLLVWELTGRGAPLGLGVEGVLSFTDRSHEWIVRGFTALTTDHMHRIWERQR